MSTVATGLPTTAPLFEGRKSVLEQSLVIAPARCMGLLAIMPIGRPSIRARAVTMPRAQRGRSSRTDPSSAISDSADRTS